MFHSNGTNLNLVVGAMAPCCLLSYYYNSSTIAGIRLNPLFSGIVDASSAIGVNDSETEIETVVYLQRVHHSRTLSSRCTMGLRGRKASRIDHQYRSNSMTVPL